MWLLVTVMDSVDLLIYLFFAALIAYGSSWTPGWGVQAPAVPTPDPHLIVPGQGLLTVQILE